MNRRTFFILIWLVAIVLVGWRVYYFLDSHPNEKDGLYLLPAGEILVEDEMLFYGKAPMTSNIEDTINLILSQENTIKGCAEGEIEDIIHLDCFKTDDPTILSTYTYYFDIAHNLEEISAFDDIVFYCIKKITDSPYITPLEELDPEYVPLALSSCVNSVFHEATGKGYRVSISDTGVKLFKFKETL